jgi:hypothetical protein
MEEVLITQTRSWLERERGNLTSLENLLFLHHEVNSERKDKYSKNDLGFDKHNKN